MEAGKVGTGYSGGHNIAGDYSSDGIGGGTKYVVAKQGGRDVKGWKQCESKAKYWFISPGRKKQHACTEHMRVLLRAARGKKVRISFGKHGIDGPPTKDHRLGSERGRDSLRPTIAWAKRDSRYRLRSLRIPGTRSQM